MFSMKNVDWVSEFMFDEFYVSFYVSWLFSASLRRKVVCSVRLRGWIRLDDLTEGL